MDSIIKRGGAMVQELSPVQYQVLWDHIVKMAWDTCGCWAHGCWWLMMIDDDGKVWQYFHFWRFEYSCLLSNSTFGKGFSKPLESFNLIQWLTGPTHEHGHTLDLVLSYALLTFLITDLLSLLLLSPDKLPDIMFLHASIVHLPWTPTKTLFSSTSWRLPLRTWGLEHCHVQLHLLQYSLLHHPL